MTYTTSFISTMKTVNMEPRKKEDYGESEKCYW